MADKPRRIIIGGGEPPPDIPRPRSVKRRPIPPAPDQPLERIARPDPDLAAAYLWTRNVTLVLTGLLWLLMSFCMATRPDSFAALTIFPAWTWLFLGLLLALPGWIKRKRRYAAVLTALWLIYGLVFVDETRGVVRGCYRSWPAPEWLAAREQGRALRVVSLNCKKHRVEAAEEVMLYSPDIALLQESPNLDCVRKLARDLYGRDAAVLWGTDTTIIARGRITPRKLSKDLSAYSVQAGVRLASGAEIEVVCLRLLPAVVRADLWSPECWRRQTANRRYRREQLSLVAERLRAVPSATPLIVGGDFNAPAGDAIFRLLRPRLRDTFEQAGVGWGDTYVNHAPMLRIDHIYASDRVRAAAVVVRETLWSDHRILICDLILPPAASSAAGE